MIIFQVNGKSHRLSTVKGKEKDVIKIILQYTSPSTPKAEAL